MYESPINIIYSNIRTAFENEVFSSVQKAGINVDKQELIKALAYDRQQYEKGYADAKAEYQNTIEKILVAGKEGKEALIYINGRLFAIRELAQ